jgi:hypothetical protein
LAAAIAQDAPRPDLWPDAGLPPQDDNGTLVLRLQPKMPGDLQAAPVDVAPTDADGTMDMDNAAPSRADAGTANGAAFADADDSLIASVLQTAADPAPLPPARVNDGWRSLPLAAGEDMPMAARLRALPRGALIPRSVEVAAWTRRAQSLTERMRQGGPVGTDGTPSH